MDTFEELFVAIFYTLDEMSLNIDNICNRDTSAKATSFLKLISSFSFIVSLVVTRNVFDLTLDVTKLLQTKKIDIMGCINMIKSLKNVCKLTRLHIDHHHSVYYEKALSLALQIGVKEAVPRTVGRQKHRENHEASTASDYYKKVITIQLLDHLNTEMDTRFDENTTMIYNGLSIIPNEMISLQNSRHSWQEKFKKISEFYFDDFPNPLALDAEMRLWENYWLNSKRSRPGTVTETLFSH